MKCSGAIDRKCRRALWAHHGPLWAAALLAICLRDGSAGPAVAVKVGARSGPAPNIASVFNAGLGASANALQLSFKPIPETLGSGLKRMLVSGQLRIPGDGVAEPYGQNSQFARLDVKSESDRRILGSIAVNLPPDFHIRASMGRATQENTQALQRDFEAAYARAAAQLQAELRGQLPLIRQAMQDGDMESEYARSVLSEVLRISILFKPTVDTVVADTADIAAALEAKAMASTMRRIGDVLAAKALEVNLDGSTWYSEAAQKRSRMSLGDLLRQTVYVDTGRGLMDVPMEVALAHVEAGIPKGSLFIKTPGGNIPLKEALLQVLNSNAEYSNIHVEIDEHRQPLIQALIDNADRIPFGKLFILKGGEMLPLRRYFLKPGGLGAGSARSGQDAGRAPLAQSPRAMSELGQGADEGIRQLARLTRIIFELSFQERQRIQWMAREIERHFDSLSPENRSGRAGAIIAKDTNRLALNQQLRPDILKAIQDGSYRLKMHKHAENGGDHPGLFLFQGEPGKEFVEHKLPGDGVERIADRAYRTPRGPGVGERKGPEGRSKNVFQTPRPYALAAFIQSAIAAFLLPDIDIALMALSIALFSMVLFAMPWLRR